MENAILCGDRKVLLMGRREKRVNRSLVIRDKASSSPSGLRNLRVLGTGSDLSIQCDCDYHQYRQYSHY